MGSSIKVQFQKFVDNTDGVATIWSIYWVVLFLIIGGLAVDYTNAERAKAHLQATADAIALAAVQDLPDTTLALATAEKFVTLNAPSAQYGDVLRGSEIVFGQWDRNNRNFIIGAEPYSAINVTVHRSTLFGNEVPTYFLRFAGFMKWDVAATAVAAKGKLIQPCSSGGFFSSGVVLSGSNMNYVDGFCLHGDNGVKIGSNNTFADGTKITMLDADNTFVLSDDNIIPEGVLSDGSFDFKLPYQVAKMQASMASIPPGDYPLGITGLSDDLPFEITKVIRLEKLTQSTPLIAGTLYVVELDADFGSNKMIKDIAVVAGLEIKVGSNVKLTDTVFVTNSKVLFGTNNDVGDPNFCENGHYSVYVMSGVNIEYGSESLFQGVRMGAIGEVKLGSQLRGIQGTYAESLGNIEYSSADKFGGCRNGLENKLFDRLTPPAFALAY